MNMKRFMNKKVAAIGLAAGITLGGAGAAFAFFTTTGGGTGTGAVGNPSALVIHQNSITYSNATPPGEDALVPGTSATVTFTVDNNATSNQQLGTISLASWTSDKAGCDSVTDPGWITMTNDVVSHDYAPGTGQAVSGNSVITFNNLEVPQNVCAGAALTFTYAS
jgi:hypothetical protein